MSGRVVFEDGALGAAWPELLAEAGTPVSMRVRLEDGRLVLVPTELLVAQGDGDYRAGVRAADLTHSADLPGDLAHEGEEERNKLSDPGGVISNPADTASGQGETPAHGETLVVPVVEETLSVGMQEVETGRVRLTKTVREHTETVDEPLLRRTVEVRRVPVGRLVDAAPPVRQEGGTMIVPVLEEVVVVEKRLMLVEEVHVIQEEAEFHKPQQAILRREEVSVEREQTDGGRRRDS